MLSVLHNIINLDLARLLKSPEAWRSLHVTYHPPVVERLWIQHGSFRVFLHRIHPCGEDEALWHPHPWPSAVRVISGRYEMGVSMTSSTQRPVVDGHVVPMRTETLAKIILTEGSEYEMDTPNGWHYVRVLGVPSLSVMIVDRPWKDAWPTCNFPRPTKVQAPLSDDARDALFSDFRKRFG